MKTMKTMGMAGALLLAGALLVSSCQRSGDCGCTPENPYDKSRGDVIVSSNIVKSSTRVAGETWEVSDAIGIYAANGGQELATNTIYGGNANRKYTTATSGTMVNFTSIDGVTVPSDGTVDLVAYYPYKEGTALQYSFDTSDQSKPAAIDVLYSNNQKGINKTSNRANLVFKHALTLVEFDITSDEGMAIDATSTVSMANVLVDGTLSLANGKVTTGSKTGNPSVAVKPVSGNTYRAQMILPPQDLSGKEVTFSFNGRSQKTTLRLTQTESGYKYVVEVKFTKGAVIIVDGAKINPWIDGGNNGDPIIVIGGGDTPTPTPDPVDPTDPAEVTVIYSETFASDMGKMSAINVLGDQVWKVNTQYKNVSMSGYAGGKSNANEDWLVSPAFDFTNATSALVSFKHTINKGDVSKMKQEQTLWVSTNYNGNVANATWTQVTIPTYPAGTDWTFVESGDIALPSSVLSKSSVVFAFKYLCTDASSGQWQVQDLKVKSAGGKLADGTTPTPNPPTPNPTPNPQPATGNLLAPGSNFDDWAAFTGTLNSYGLKPYATQVDGGVTGKAMLIKQDPTTENDYVFTITVPKGAPTTAKTISLYIKGTAGKSLSFNVYNTDGKTYKVFNLGAFDGTNGITLEPVTANQYTGAIDTKGQWVKVTLNISGHQLATSGNFFALKLGEKVAYDLMIDDITIE